MICMTKSQFDAKLAKIEKRNAGIEYRRRLREERWKYFPKFVKPTTSKLVLIVAALLCLEIIIFCEYMIVKTGDTNALYAMVGAVASLASVVLGYFVKSTKENTIGGITFESAMANLGNPDIIDAPGTEAVG